MDVVWGKIFSFLKNAIGYDISSHAIDFCLKKGIPATNNINDVGDESCDLVFSAHVLEHHPHPKQMIEEMRSKIKPGRNLLLVLLHERHKKERFTLDLNQHLYNWNFRNINNLLIVSGFEINTNTYVRGACYSKLLPLANFNFHLYYFLTKAAAMLFGIKEMMILATKK